MKQARHFSRIPQIIAGALLLLGMFLAIARWSPTRTRAADNSTQIFLPLISQPISFHRPPQPLTLPVRLDPGLTTVGIILGQPGQIQLEPDRDRAIQATLSAHAAVITAIASDGSSFTLEVPEGAVVSDTQIVMTPIAAIDGQPLGGSSGAAVQLQPEGLQFLLPVTLTIQTSAPIPVESELSISWHGDGEEIYRYPLLLEHPYPQVAFRTMHFSGFGYLGDNISIPVDNHLPIPSDPEDQFKQAWEEVLRREREAQTNGQPGDPDFFEKLTELLRAYYYQVVKPIMQVAEGDCNDAESGAVAKGMLWAHEAEILGARDLGLAPELDEFHDSFIRVLENCWQERTQPCVNRNDLNQWRAVLSIARQGQMLGLNFDPNSVPECNCSGYASIPAWNLTYSVSFHRDAEASTGSGDYTTVAVHHEQAGSILLNNAKGWPPYPGWDSGDNLPTGNAMLDDSSTTYLSDGRQFHNSSVGSGVVGGYAYLEIDEENCTYDLDLDVITHGVDDSFQTEPVEKNMMVLALYLLDRNAYSADPSTTTLSGEADLQASLGGGYYSENISVGGGYGTHPLFNILGENAGTGHASWTLTPLP